MDLTKERFEKLNLVTLIFIGIYIVAAERILEKASSLGHSVNSALSILSSIGVYKFVILAVHNVVENIEFFRKIYWGKCYIGGYWIYEYTINGEKKFGIWNVIQTMRNTSIVGYGLDTGYNVRSRFRTISELIERDGVYEVIMLRDDNENNSGEHLSRTEMLFEYTRKQFGRGRPYKITAKTTIYGGKFDGQTHNAIVKKYENVNSNDDLVSIIRANA